MIVSTITCDLCREKIKDTVCTLYYEGQLGHNRVPSGGWQFHYNCFSVVVTAILSTLTAGSGLKEQDHVNQNR